MKRIPPVITGRKGMRNMMSQKKILVVDDEDMILDMVSALLKEQGYWVVTAKHPSLAAIQAADADLVILDLKLSEKSDSDGVGVLNRLWENKTWPVPIIIFSAYLNSGRVKDNLDGALRECDEKKNIYDYIEKGKGIKQLIDSVDSFFKNKQN
jgi:CheY-like chemotaxis protein